MTDASGSSITTSKLGILVELEMRIAFVESKIQVAHEDYEREVTLAAQEFRQRVLAITGKVLADEFRIFLKNFRDSEILLAADIALLGYGAPRPAPVPIGNTC